MPWLTVTAEPTLVIISGLPGSGKTTVAKRLAHERPGVRLCPDDWMDALGADIWDSDFRERVEQFQRALAADLLRCGTTAIIEWGTWAYEEREQLRRDAVAVSARTEFIVLDLPLETLWQRVVERGREDPPITRDHFQAYDDAFQRPNDSEVAAYDAFTRMAE